MALDFKVEEQTGRFLLTDVPVTSFAAPVTPVSVGPAVVGQVELTCNGSALFSLYRPLRDSGRPFRLEETRDPSGLISSIELNWI